MIDRQSNRETRKKLIRFGLALGVMAYLPRILNPGVALAQQDFFLDSKVFTFHFESGPGVEQTIKQMNDEGRENHTAFELVSALQEGRSLPKSYVITLDDGYAQQMNTLDKLAKYNAKATFFYIPWEGDGVHTYLTPTQIKEISDLGHEIGCHTRNHPTNLPSIMRSNWGDYLNQVVGSKKIIEEIINPDGKKEGMGVWTFAYPYGVTSPELATDLANYYLGAFTTVSGNIHARSRAMLLPRISVN